jgi:hypothetical protein
LQDIALQGTQGLHQRSPIKGFPGDALLVSAPELGPDDGFIIHLAGTHPNPANIFNRGRDQMMAENRLFVPAILLESAFDFPPGFGR